MQVRVALIQINASDDPAQNLVETTGLISRACDQGATFVLTPEVTNTISASRTRQTEVLQTEENDATLAALTALALQRGIWLLIGSLALKTHDPDGRFVNRSFLISPQGGIVARYDKIHMFDVQVSETETYKESAGYRPGMDAVLADTGFGLVGLTICYDVRFPHLYRHLAQNGAQMITVPSAFSPVTGAAHWEILLRARAIETGAFILAPAQTGKHTATRGKRRETYGHSMIVDPWGRVLLNADTEPGVFLVNLELNLVKETRSRIPALSHDRDYQVNPNARRID